MSISDKLGSGHASAYMNAVLQSEKPPVTLMCIAASMAMACVVKVCVRRSRRSPKGRLEFRLMHNDTVNGVYAAYAADNAVELLTRVVNL